MFPSFLRQKLPLNKKYFEMKKLLKDSSLFTVCEEAKCPNRFYCFEKKSATFLLCGKYCTRKCSFCDISFSEKPLPLDPNEPKKIAALAKKLKLKHIVITMVSRDDLPDLGANHIATAIKEIKKENPQSIIEALVSDFQGKYDLLDIILKAKPHIFNHNIETVLRLSHKIRNRAKYETSLNNLKYVKEKNHKIYVKSGFMVGLGEFEKEVFQTIKDLYLHKCDIVTIGQYLQPSKKCVKVKKIIDPNSFKKYESFGSSLKIKYMYCGPFVRSSFNAEKFLTHLY